MASVTGTDDSELVIYAHIALQLVKIVKINLHRSVIINNDLLSLRKTYPYHLFYKSYLKKCLRILLAYLQILVEHF